MRSKFFRKLSNHHFLTTDRCLYGLLIRDITSKWLRSNYEKHEISITLGLSKNQIVYIPDKILVRHLLSM